jgi:hypothetical protein
MYLPAQTAMKSLSIDKSVEQSLSGEVNSCSSGHEVLRSLCKPNIGVSFVRL